MQRRKYAIILAGGHGVRMGSALPKQFLEVDGKPVLRHTIERFLDYDKSMELVLVLPSDQKEWWKKYCDEKGFMTRYVLATGGITRFHSVQNALRYVEDKSLVAVHDGVRPLINSNLLDRLFSAAEQHCAIVPVMGMIESLRLLSGDGSSSSINRDNYVSVQTPQVFHSEVLKKAYEQPYSQLFTDDASVVEAAGYSVTLVEGLRYNLKITTPEDLKLASFLLG